MRCREPAVRHIVQDGVVEEHAVLRDDPYGLTETLQAHLPDVPVANQDAAIQGVVETVQETDDGGLAERG